MTVTQDEKLYSSELAEVLDFAHTAFFVSLRGIACLNLAVPWPPWPPWPWCSWTDCDIIEQDYVTMCDVHIETLCET